MKFSFPLTTAVKRAGILVLIVGCLADGMVGPAFGQGGKAEPRRVTLSTVRGGLELAGKLSNGQEMEFVFAGAKGQVLKITNPTPDLFDYRIFRNESDFETEFESSRVSSFELPDTGDYLLFIRKKQVKSPRTARFSITIATNQITH